MFETKNRNVRYYQKNIEIFVCPKIDPKPKSKPEQTQILTINFSIFLLENTRKNTIMLGNMCDNVMKNLLYI